ncbi:MAG: alcohol dehydrogenase catalytic domain-containing protein [Planctomycetes bacterium]|nr:alcohol dehydrogenase catalytic domain-containing protein [Planctomycetota bacterium]
MTTIAFEAMDYRADRSFVVARYRLEGDPDSGWLVVRDGVEVLRLGRGYRALKVRSCGVCATDLARHFLPFPLPQVIGHEVIALDERGRRYVVEINASHHARGVVDDCPFCRGGLPTHCPARLTLGIHGLPGGFGPWILAPVGACLPVPDEVPDDVAVLVEPLAAALHAATMVAPRAGERVAVLGPRRLGMLVLACLAALRRRVGADGWFSIVGVMRDESRRELAERLGADDVELLDDNAEDGLEQKFDVVIDTTGNPTALAHALRLARREVHLKSTHGQVSAGVAHLTELVVDELRVERFAAERVTEGARVAWLAAAPPPADFAASRDVHVGAVDELARHFWSLREGLPRADVAVVGSAAQLAQAIRPVAGDERSLVRPRGRVLVHPDANCSGSGLVETIVRRDVVLSSSRCGDFVRTLELLRDDPALRDIAALITHRFPSAELPRAFDAARGHGCIKAIVEQP